MSEKYLGESIKKLGFGFMRLPQIPGGKFGDFDVELTKKLVDRFIEGGGTYFDTAYAYKGSEELLRQTLVERYPRDKFQIASKMPLVDTEDPKEVPEKFEESLRRLGTDFFDFYLLHALNSELNKKAEKLGVWEYLVGEKAKGRIRNLGFSFHGPASELDEILTLHPEAEFVQLQVNYIDWDNDKVQSRLCCETAEKHGKPIVIMEPVKGGILAVDDSPVAPILKEYAPDKSVASWAMRFAATRKNLITALSGMNTLEMMDDNLATVNAAVPFNDEESAVLQKAIDKINSIPRVPCTGCRYCVDNCPKNIKIPELMHVYSDYLSYNTTTNTEFSFFEAVRDAGKPSECVKCLSCEGHCPQHINITEVLEKVVTLYEKR